MNTHIICGLGQVGYRVCDLLLRLGEQVEVVTLESREERITELRDRGARVHIGDAQNPHALREAGIEHADSLITVTGKDLVNIEIALDARQLRPDMPLIVRIFDESLGARLEETLGLRKAVGRSSLAAPVFASAVLGESVRSSFTVAGQTFVVGTLSAGDDSPKSGSVPVILRKHDGSIEFPVESNRKITAHETLTVLGPAENWYQKPAITPARFLFSFFNVWRQSSLPIRRVFGALLGIALVSLFVFQFGMGLSFIDAMYFVITTITTVGYGDITPIKASAALKLYACLLMLVGSATLAAIYSLITDFVVTARFQQLLGRHRIPEKDHVVVVGLGNIGYRVAEELHRLQLPQVAVENRSEGTFVEAVRSFAPVLIGDARTVETLVKAGIKNAHAVLAVTSDDAVNLTVSLVSRELNPGIRAITRIFDPLFAEKIQKPLSIDIALSASRIAAPTFVASALYENVVGACLLDERTLLSFVCRKAGTAMAGQKPSVLRSKNQECLLYRKTSGTFRFQPIVADDSPLAAEDDLILVKIRSVL